jgi:hypothetical protein
MTYLKSSLKAIVLEVSLLWLAYAVIKGVLLGYSLHYSLYVAKAQCKNENFLEEYGMKKLLSLLLFGGLILTACSSQTDTKNVNQPSTVSSNTNTEKDSAVKDYMKKVTIKLGNITADVNKLTEYTKRAKENPNMINDSVFGYQVKDSCSQLNRDIQAIKEVYPGTDKRVIHIHNLILKGITELEYVSNNYPIALLSRDSEGIRLAVKHMTEGVSYLNEASLEYKSNK